MAAVTAGIARLIFTGIFGDAAVLAGDIAHVFTITGIDDAAGNPSKKEVIKRASLREMPFLCSGSLQYF